MQHFRHNFFIVGFLFIVGFCFVGWQTQISNAQTKPLTYTEINTALNTKLPNKAFKSKAQLINFLITQIKQRKVDKPLTPDREDLLREAGATDELIEAVRQNSPSLPITQPAKTPVIVAIPTPTPVVSTNNNILKNSLGMEFVHIPSGSFMMGSPTTESGRLDNETLHRVTISKDFYLGKTEVTQEQWTTVMGSNPSSFKDCPKCPVETVSWEDVQNFISKLNSKGEGRYRLPTEAEWEYACRAGSTTKYSYGEGEGLLGGYAWYSGNSGSKTHEVASKQANDWGLYDMHGNVWEWCNDWYGEYSSGAVTDPIGGTTGSYRFFRGGGWNHAAGDLRSAYRNFNSPSNRYRDLGFRLIWE